MTATEVVQQWFDAHAAGDLVAARALLAADAPVVVPGARLTGFDQLMEWYRRRVESEGPGFGYDLVDLLSSSSRVAAVLAMRNGTRTWRQVALYTVEGGRITSLWAAED